MEDDKDMMDEIGEDADMGPDEIEEEVSNEGGNGDVAEENGTGVGDEGDDDFEYDENGDIVIPEDEEDADGEGEAAPAESAPEPPAEDEEKATLRRRLAAFEEQAKDTLSKMGVSEQDPLKGLAKLAAEAEGKSEEEYLRDQREKRELAAARARVQREAFEKRMQADLARIHAAYPETKMYKSPEEFPNFKRFGELVDSGNTPEEAYIASHPDTRAKAVIGAAQQHTLNGTKKHLRSSVPTGGRAGDVTIPRSELREWRELFPGMSDRELTSLYKKTL